MYKIIEGTAKQVEKEVNKLMKDKKKTWLMGSPLLVVDGKYSQCMVIPQDLPMPEQLDPNQSAE